MGGDTSGDLEGAEEAGVGATSSIIIIIIIIIITIILLPLSTNQTNKQRISSNPK
jgi:ABC-type sugar transport system permease subunit